MKPDLLLLLCQVQEDDGQRNRLDVQSVSEPATENEHPPQHPRHRISMDHLAEESRKQIRRIRVNWSLLTKRWKNTVVSQQASTMNRNRSVATQTQSDGPSALPSLVQASDTSVNRFSFPETHATSEECTVSDHIYEPIYRVTSIKVKEICQVFDESQ